jgi:hypothetical protein
MELLETHVPKPGRNAGCIHTLLDTHAIVKYYAVLLAEYHHMRQFRPTAAGRGKLDTHTPLYTQASLKKNKARHPEREKN